jgi:hypothetical protein
LSIVVYICNTSIQEAEAGGAQLLGYIVNSRPARAI